MDNLKKKCLKAEELFTLVFVVKQLSSFWVKISLYVLALTYYGKMFIRDT